MIRHATKEPESPVRVVILGATGFVGRHLKAYLDERSVPAVGLSSADCDLTASDATLQLNKLFGPDDTVVFASGLTPDKGRDSTTLMQNLAMGKHVADVVAAGPPRHLVYLSSDAVYGGPESLIYERTPAAASDLYGLMHRTREAMLQEAAGDRSLLAILRPVAIYGPGDSHNSYGPNRFVRSAVHESTITLFGNGEERRDHIWIDDVINAIVAVILRRSSGILNLASGSAVSFREVADQVRDVVGPHVAIRSQDKSSQVTHRHFDNAELISAFPRFQFTSLRDGLRTTVEHIRTPKDG